MRTYRISKYNPKFRDANGVFLRDEWTSISDVGKFFGDYQLRTLDYQRVENLYLNAFEFVLKSYGINALIIQDLELHDFNENDAVKDLYTDDLKEVYDKLKENICLSTQKEILSTIRLILREHIWGKLVAINLNLQFEFGYDFYAYINTNALPGDLIEEIRNTGLFVEEMNQ